VMPAEPVIAIRLPARTRAAGRLMNSLEGKVPDGRRVWIVPGKGNRRE
jgi:hypothetical protein